MQFFAKTQRPQGSEWAIETHVQNHQKLKIDTATATRVLTFDPKVPRDGRPHLECQVPSIVNHHTHSTHGHSLAWAVEMGLVERENKNYRKLDKGQFSKLAGRTYPFATPEELALISDFIVFLFFFDDSCCDNQDTVQDETMKEILELEDKLLAIVSSNDSNLLNDEGPLERSLSNVCGRIKHLGKGAWLDRFADNMTDYIEGCRWERHLRLQGTTPSLATYSRLRPLVSGMFPCFDFTGMFVDGLDPEEVTNNALVHQLETFANNHVGWVNDIYGIDKELTESSTSNLVIVLATEFGMSWDEAIDFAIRMCNREFQAFCELESLVVPSTESPLHHYVQGMKNWMRGNFDWYSDTARYKSS